MPKKAKSASKDTERVPATIAPNADIPQGKTSRRAPSKPRKTAAKKLTKRGGSKASGASSTIPSLPTDEEIRLRAYFISERRHRLALPGDATSDWEEARRQLLFEGGPR